MAHEAMNLLEFPPEIMHHIISFLDENAANELRSVCRYLNALCKDVLVKEIGKLRWKTQKLLNEASYHVETPPPLLHYNLTNGYAVLLQVFSSLTLLMDEQNCSGGCCCFDMGKVREKKNTLIILQSELLISGKLLTDTDKVIHVVKCSRKFLELVQTEKVMKEPNLLAIVKPLLKFLRLSLTHAPNLKVVLEICINAMTLNKWLLDNILRSMEISTLLSEMIGDLNILVELLR